MQNKSFDCVQTKHDIQRKLREEYAGLSPGEIGNRQSDKIEKNPVLKKYIRDFKSIPTKSKRHDFANRT